MRESRKRAVKYFDARGINPNTKPEITRILDFNPIQTWSQSSDGTTTYPCTIEIEAFFGQAVADAPRVGFVGLLCEHAVVDQGF